MRAVPSAPLARDVAVVVDDAGPEPDDDVHSTVLFVLGGDTARLCARLGVDQLDVLAAGDGLNDHEMLTWAGHGVTMGNADPAPQRIADEVTASNDDDGVARIVERRLGASAGGRREVTA